VAAGVAAVGPEAIVTALDRLELPRLSGATRSAMKADATLRPDLRRCLASAGGQPPARG
jgi:hypothetical protein